MALSRFQQFFENSPENKNFALSRRIDYDPDMISNLNRQLYSHDWVCV
jgi:hypothetical protein